MIKNLVCSVFSLVTVIVCCVQCCSQVCIVPSLMCSVQCGVYPGWCAVCSICSVECGVLPRLMCSMRAASVSPLATVMESRCVHLSQISEFLPSSVCESIKIHSEMDVAPWIGMGYPCVSMGTCRYKHQFQQKRLCRYFCILLSQLRMWNNRLIKSICHLYV